MRRLVILAVAWAAAAPFPAEASPTSQPASAPAADANDVGRIGRLIEQLSADKYTHREAAHQELLRLGRAAVGALRSADANRDPERAVRVQEVLRQIEATVAEQAWLDAARTLPKEYPPRRFLGDKRLAGRAVDGNGRPLPGAVITLRSGALGQDLWWAFCPATRSDANGRFEFAIPFDDILYQFGAQRMGYYMRRPHCAIPRAQGPADIVLDPVRNLGVLRGSVSAGGKAVPDLEVQLVGEYGMRTSARTDKEGRFAWEGLPEYFGHGIVQARWGNLVAPLQIVRGGDRGPVDLILDKAAELEGAVREEDGGKPIAGATVIVQPWFSSGVQLTATTDRDGKYRIRGIPPGEYQVTAEGAAHFRRPPRGADYNLPKILLSSGGTVAVDIRMERVAVARGRVVDHAGAPVPGALVSIPSTWGGDYRDQYRYVEADKDGRFSIATGHVGNEERLTLSAFSSRKGLAHKQVGPFLAGTIYSDIAVQLPGAAYVKGTVTDANGRPIPGVVCVIDSGSSISVETGEDGSFDLGRVSFYRPELRAVKRVMFRAPRPQRGDAYGRTYSFDSKYVAVESRQKAPQFYLNAQVPLEAKPGQELDLKVVLKPTQLLEFAGTVVEANDTPVGNAEVHLFTGDADANSWMETLHPRMTGGDDRPLPHENVVLAATRTDSSGRWRIWAVREDGVACPMAGPQADWKRFCVGAHFYRRADGWSAVLVRDVVVLQDDPRRELRLKLASTAPPPAGVR